MNCRYLIPLCFGLVTTSALAAPPCLEEAHQFQQALMQRPPLDPRVMHDALELRHEGTSLCNRGAVAQGRAKLQEALNRITPPGFSLSTPGTAPPPAGKR